MMDMPGWFLSRFLYLCPCHLASLPENISDMRVSLCAWFV